LSRWCGILSDDGGHAGLGDQRAKQWQLPTARFQRSCGDVVGMVFPFHCTTVFARKPLPFTVIAKSAFPALIWQ